MKPKVEIIGGEKLSKTLSELGYKAKLEALRGVKATAMEVLADAGERLTKGGHRVTSKLFASGKVERSDEEKDAYEVSYSAEYATYVEFGRRPGKGLNNQGIENVAQWAKKKGILNTYNIKTRRKSKAGVKDIDQRARAFALWLSGRYKRRGRKGTPFLFPAFEAKKGNLGKNIGKQIAALIKELGK